MMHPAIIHAHASARERINAKYRRAYDRLYTASAKAGSAEECARINAALARINRERDAALAALEGR